MAVVFRRRYMVYTGGKVGLVNGPTVVIKTIYTREIEREREAYLM